MFTSRGRCTWLTFVTVTAVLLLLSFGAAQDRHKAGGADAGQVSAGQGPRDTTQQLTATLASRARTFEATVDLFADRYWDPHYRDWKAWAEQYRQAAYTAEERPIFDATMRRMIAELGDDHSRWLGLDTPAPDTLAETAEVASVPHGEKLASGVGYLSVPSFTAPGTAAAAHLALANLMLEGVTTLIVDLRGNLGGSVSELGAFLGAFISGEWGEAEGRGRLLWSAIFDDASSSALLLAPDGRRLRDLTLEQSVKFRGPVAVLVDAATGSAAEVAAFVLAERAGAVVVGERTRGNVEVVQGFGLPDGSSVLVAIGNMRLPGGVSMDAGLTPEIVGRASGRELSVGFDAPLAAAEGRLGGLPFVPGRWLR